MAALGNRVTTTTQDKILPSAVDTILNSNVAAGRFLRAAKKWSGDLMKRPVKVSKNSTGTSFSGFDTFSTNATDNRVMLQYHPKFYQISVALPLDELSANATEDKVIDLAAIEIEGAAQDMADDVGTLLYADGTGNSSKDFLGLAAHVDDGNTVATIGGQSRSTYSTLASTVTASGGTISLAKLTTLFNAVASGSVKPTVAYCDETVFGLLEQLYTPQERIMKEVSMVKGGLVTGSGYSALYHKGVPIIQDEKATSQTFFYLNEDFMDFHALPVYDTKPVQYKSQIQGNDYSSVLGLGFSWSGWIKPSNSATLVGHIYLGGELVGWNPKRNGKLTGITAV